ncbi:MAG TPA: TolC family protein [Salinivirga sp.]|uniref:TolC family protein n=1 Tax=Salinivirga sp. TaxID=1970192 RepID=UPI002B465E3F|nr:TolC family protein [Salinivirga sp.]HKK58016.1 TolC family protein [Salinivirga sp.]
MNRIAQFIILLIFIQATSLQSQNNKISLERAVETSLKNNPALKQWEARLKAKKQERKLAYGIENPELTYFKEGINDNTTPAFDEQRIAISQSVDFPLKSIYKVKKSKGEYRVLEMQFLAFKRNLTANVKRLYVDLLYAIYYQKLTGEQFTLAKNLNDAVQSRAEAGAGTGMDQLKAEIQLAKAKNDIDYAERILHQARYELFNVMGLGEDDQKYTIAFDDTLRTKNDVIDQDAALEFTSKHPNYTSYVEKQRAAEYGVKAAKSGYLPDISFSLYQQDYGDGYDFTGFEVGLSIPLWFTINQHVKTQQALAKLEEFQWKQKEVLLNMKMQIEHAWHNYEASKQNLERFKEIIAIKSDKLRSLTLEAYKLGEIDLLNLLNAQQLYLDTRKNYLKVLQDYYLQLIELEKYMNKEIVY